MANTRNAKDGDGFVLGMTRQAGRLAVHCSFDGHEEVRPLEVLKSIGPLHGTAKVTGETDLATWEEVPAKEWADGVGIAAAELNHRVWQATIAGKRVLIPALALLQALFRPPKYVLEPTFRPQGIDGVCTMIDGAPVPTRNWNSAFNAHLAQVFIGPMTWMHCFPSARKMSASIYECAREGILGCELATGRLAIEIRGVDKGGRLYGTRVFVSQIITEEAPFPFAEGVGGTIAVHEWGSHWSDARPIPRRDGVHALSDDEWAGLQPLLPNRNRAFSVRAVIDEILSNLCSAQTEGEYDARLAAKAKQQFRYWSRSGLWEQIATVLRDARPAEAGEVVADGVRMRRNRRSDERQAEFADECGLNLSHYGPFTDGEWAEFSQHIQVKNGSKRRSSREVWDAILEGVGDGIRWRRGTDPGALSDVAGVSYARLRRQGKWPKLAEVLNGLRPMESTT